MTRLMLVLLVAVALGCGDDGSATTDAGIDAPVADAGPCGDDLFYQVEVFDWSTDISVPNSEIPGPMVTATEVGSESNTTMVAPNGRAVLCLERGAPRSIRFESTVHLPHIEVVDPTAYEAAAGPTNSYRVYVLKQADLDGLAAGTGAAPNGHVFFNIQGDVGDFTASIGTGSDPGLVGSPGGTFAAGTTTSATDTYVVFRNAIVGAGQTDLTITGGLPCSMPENAPVVAGTTTGVLALCFFGP